MSTVTVVGNITRDLELRYTPSGTAKTAFGLAENRRWTNRQTGASEESTSFFNIVAWGTLAENIATSLGKGDRVIVTGRLDQRSWEADDGGKRSVVEIVADSIGPDLRFATAEIVRNEREGGRNTGGGRGGGGGGRTAPPAAPEGEDPWGEEPF